MHKCEFERVLDEVNETNSRRGDPCRQRKALVPVRISPTSIRSPSCIPKPVEVIPGVFSAIVATAPPTYENAGHNNNLSFIVTGEGVVVINSGASSRLAEALHDEIKKVTDQPVVLVINENGQGHAMLGNGYWRDQGVDILAHADAIAETTENGDFIFQGMERYNRERAEGSRVEHSQSEL